MLAALAQGRRPETDASDNLKSLAMVLAALTSAREGRRIELEQARRCRFLKTPSETAM